MLSYMCIAEMTQIVQVNIRLSGIYAYLAPTSADYVNQKHPSTTLGSQFIETVSLQHVFVYMYNCWLQWLIWEVEHCIIKILSSCVMGKCWNSLNGGLHYMYVTSRGCLYHALNRYQHSTFYCCHVCDEGHTFPLKITQKQHSFCLSVVTYSPVTM